MQSGVGVCPVLQIQAPSGQYVLAVDTCQQAIISTDGGKNWARASGLPYSGLSEMVSSGSRLFAKGLNLDNVSAPCFYRSDDQGANWVLVQNINSGYYDMGDIVATDNGILLFHARPELFVSTDHGDSWIEVPNPPNLPHGNFRAVGSHIYFFGLEGLYVSDDNGLTWTDHGDALSTTSYDLSVVGAFDSLLLGGEANGGCRYTRSTDGGQTWAEGIFCDSRCFQNTSYGLFAGTLSYDHDWSGLLRSTDSGATWEVPSGWAFGTAKVTFILEAEGVLLAAGEDSIARTVIYRSTDGGENWVKSSTGIPFSTALNWTEGLAYDPAVGKIYATGRQFGKVYVSTDLGQTWKSAGPYGGLR